MPGIKELKTRIKSIGSTRKITRAMQMVSAAKMRKAQNAVLQSRNYASLAWETILSVAKQGAFKNPLIRAYSKAKKIGIILLSSNKGFVGSLNTNLLAKLKEIDPSTVARDDNVINNEVICEIVTYGKKGQILATRLNKTITADFAKPERFIKVEEIYPIAQFISESYARGEYKKIYLVYNHFLSTLQQKPAARQLLPFTDSLRHELEDFDASGAEMEQPIIYEPNPAEVVNHLIPRIIESQIYQTILETDASEHSARMVMMKNATEAAGDLIGDLTLTYNQIRQNKITTELAEITAGKIALE